MRLRSLALRCILAALVLFAGVPSGASGEPPSLSASVVSSSPGGPLDRVIVRLRDASARGRGRTMAAHGLKASDLSYHGRGFAGVRVPKGRSAEALIAELRADPNVADAEPVVRRYPSAYEAPDDPAYTDAATRTVWDSSSPYGRSWWLRETGLDAAAAWRHGFSDPSARDFPARAAASAFKVAVIDTGFYMNHPDRGPNIVAGHDFFDHYTNGTVYEDDDVTPPADNALWDGVPSIYDASHGTCTAGEIGATTHNGTGVASVGYDGQVVVYKVAGVDTGTNQVYITNEAMIAALGRAVDDGCKVISISLGGSDSSRIEQAAIDDAWAAGVVIVAASGNDYGGKVQYPAAYDNVVAVGAASVKDGVLSRSAFSNYGKGLDITAPGEMIWGLAKPGYDDDGSGTSAEPGYLMWRGTSMATPAAAGALAHMWRYVPSLTNGQIVDLVQRSAIPAGAGQPNNDYGWGYLDMSRAMSSIMSSYPYLAAPVLHMPDTPLPGAYTVSWDPVAGHSVVYEVSLDGSVAATTTGTSRILTFSPGAHTVRVQATSALDYWDAASGTEAATTVYAPTESWGTLSPAGWVATRTPEVSVQVRDSAHGIVPDSAEYRASSDGGVSWSGWLRASLAPGATPNDTATVSATPTFTVDSATADQVQFRIEDGASALGTSPVYTVAVDASSPSGDFTLAGGASEVGTNVVSLSSSVTDVSAIRMRVSLGGGTDWGAWGPYVAQTAVALPRTSGAYDVRVQYEDEAGNLLERAHTITLAIAPPGAWRLVSPAGWSSSRTTAVVVEVRDAVSGLDPSSAQVRFTSDGGASWSSWLPASLTGAPGSTGVELLAAVVPFAAESSTADRVEVRVSNGAHVTGTSGAFTIKVDATAPTGTMQLGDGSGATATTTVPVTSDVTDASALQMRLSVDGGATWGGWTAYATNTSVVLPEANGSYDVRAQYRDEAGNVLPLARTISLRMVAALERVAGANRYDTALATSRAHFAQADTVVVATGAEFADALSAAALAGSYGGPLLLTTPDALYNGIPAEIARLGAGQALVVGGEPAVSAAALAGLTAIPGLSVRRIAGPDRYATSAAIAEEVSRHETAMGRPLADEFLLARGDLFADALAASPMAYARRMPILLTRPTALPPVTVEAIQALWPQASGSVAVIAGSATAVGSEVTGRLDLDRREWVRVAGPTRYDTAAALADYATARGWTSWRSVGVATGANFPDALGGGAATGASGGVLLLTQPASLSPQVSTRLVTHRGDVRRIEVFGGPPAVSEGVLAVVGQIVR